MSFVPSPPCPNPGALGLREFPGAGKQRPSQDGSGDMKQPQSISMALLDTGPGQLPLGTRSSSLPVLS